MPRRSTPAWFQAAQNHYIQNQLLPLLDQSLGIGPGPNYGSPGAPTGRYRPSAGAFSGQQMPGDLQWLDERIGRGNSLIAQADALYYGTDPYSQVQPYMLNRNPQPSGLIDNPYVIERDRPINQEKLHTLQGMSTPAFPTNQQTHDILKQVERIRERLSPEAQEKFDVFKREMGYLESAKGSLQFPGEQIESKQKALLDQARGFPWESHVAPMDYSNPQDRRLLNLRQSSASIDAVRESYKQILPKLNDSAKAELTDILSSLNSLDKGLEEGTLRESQYLEEKAKFEKKLATHKWLSQVKRPGESVGEIMDLQGRQFLNLGGGKFQSLGYSTAAIEEWNKSGKGEIKDKDGNVVAITDIDGGWHSPRSNSGLNAKDVSDLIMRTVDKMADEHYQISSDPFDRTAALEDAVKYAMALRDGLNAHESTPGKIGLQQQLQDQERQDKELASEKQRLHAVNQAEQQRAAMAMKWEIRQEAARRDAEHKARTGGLPSKPKKPEEPAGKTDEVFLNSMTAKYSSPEDFEKNATPGERQMMSAIRAKRAK